MMGVGNTIYNFSIENLPNLFSVHGTIKTKAFEFRSHKQGSQLVLKSSKSRWQGENNGALKDGTCPTHRDL